MDSVAGRRVRDEGERAPVRLLMERFGVLLGLAPDRAQALARRLAEGSNELLSEAEALTRMRRAAHEAASEDAADRALIATWLTACGGAADAPCLPQPGPASGGLPMPRQSLALPALIDVTQWLAAPAPRRRPDTVRSDA